MKRGFFLGRSQPPVTSAEQPAAPTPSTAEQPAHSFTQPAGSAGQPASQVAQSSSALHSIADVDSWLKTNAAALGSSAETTRIKDVVEVLKVKPRARKEVVEKFFKLWNVKQKIKKDHRPLAELVQELSAKVVQAANRLELDLPSVTPRAEQPSASSAAPPASQEPPKSFDLDLALRRDAERQQDFEDLYGPGWSGRRAESQSQSKHKKPNLPRQAFGFLQECRKYRDHQWVVGEEENKINKIIRQLEIHSQPRCTKEMCRELYRLTDVGDAIGTFAAQNKEGHRQEQDYEFVRRVAFDLSEASTCKQLVSFLRGRDALPADAYPYMAQLETLGVKVQRMTNQERILEIYKDLPKTDDLPLLPDYAERELLYRMVAQKRDKAAGIAIEGPDAIDLAIEALRALRLEEEEEEEEEVADPDEEEEEVADPDAMQV